MTRERLDQLLNVVAGMSGLLIVPHTDPDPDAIASMVALAHLLAEARGLAAEIAYKGIIERAENKAMVRYLGFPLRALTDADLHQPKPTALVDTHPGAGNNPLPPTYPVAVVIDHHAWHHATADVAFADVRSDVGATSTIVTEYLQEAEIEPTSPLATALFYGIKTDTMGLGRGATAADAAAYFYLQPRIDVAALHEIERAQVPPDYFKSLVATLRATWIYDHTVIAYAGLMDYPDLAAEIADLLLRLEGARWVVCMGAYRDDLILSVRTRDRLGHAEQLVQVVVGDRGSAGGHGLMAAAHIPLRGEDPERLAQVFRRLVLKHLRVPPEVPGRRLV